MFSKTLALFTYPSQQLKVDAVILTVHPELHLNCPEQYLYKTLPCVIHRGLLSLMQVLRQAQYFLC